MPQIGNFAVRIVMIVVWVLGSCADSRCVFGNTTQDAMIDELSDIMKKEVDELILNLERVDSLDDFNTCVSALSFYGQFAEASLPHVIQLLKGNMLRRDVASAFDEENFRLCLLQYFDSISASAIVPLIQIAVDSSLDQRTRDVASEAIGIVAKNSCEKSSFLASMIENTLTTGTAEKNSKLYHNMLRSYSELVEPSDTTQTFLLELVASSDFHAKMFGIEILCKSHRKSPIVLKTIVKIFQELRNSNQIQVNRPYSIVVGYGELGLFDETIDSYLSLESLESGDSVWRIICMESMINTREDSSVPRTRVLTELQDALNSRPVSPPNLVIINRVLKNLEDWDLEYLRDAELLLVDCVEESSLDDLRAVAFELLDKLNSDRLINLARLSAKSQNRGLRLLALKQLHFKQRSLDAEDMSFLIEFAVDEDEFLDYRVIALTIIEALSTKISANSDRLENVWQNPGPPELRFAAYQACKQIQINRSRKTPE